MTSRPKLPGNLETNRRLDRWVRFEPDRTVTILTGKIEIGQGIVTTLAQIAAEELDVDLARIRMAPIDTLASPNEGHTSASRSTDDSGSAVRYACAEARALLAARSVGAARHSGRQADGAGRRDRRLRPHPRGELLGPAACARSSREKRRGALRRSLPRSFASSARACRVSTSRRRSPACRASSTISSCRACCSGASSGRRRSARRSKRSIVKPSSACPVSSTVFVDGNFIGVVAEREEQAVRAREAAMRAARWRHQALVTDADGVYGLSAEPSESDGGSARQAHGMFLDPGLRRNDETRFAAIADERPAGGRSLRRNRGRALRTLKARLHQAVSRARRARSFVRARPHRRRDDRSLDAQSGRVSAARGYRARARSLARAHRRASHGRRGLLRSQRRGRRSARCGACFRARAAGVPCRCSGCATTNFSGSRTALRWSSRREAALDADGRIVEWRLDTWSSGHTSRPARVKTETRISSLRSAWEIAKPAARIEQADAGGVGGISRNAIALYDFPRQRVVTHRVEEVPLRTSSMRALGAYANVFASESFMDELAEAAGRDPVEFRLAHMNEPRARAVIELAAEKAGWKPGVESDGTWGRGFGFAQFNNAYGYFAVAVELELEPKLRVDSRGGGRRRRSCDQSGRDRQPDGRRHRSGRELDAA